MMKNKFLSVIFTILITTWASSGQDFDEKLKLTNKLVSEEKYEEAIEAYQSLINSGEGDSIQLAWVYGYSGTCYESLGKTDEAVSSYIKAVEMGFPNYSVYDKLNSIGKKKKDYQAQKVALEAKARMFPEVEVASLKSLCYVYANLKEYQQLEKTTATLISFPPVGYKTYYFRAVAFQQTKNVSEAMVNYKEALAVKPDDYGSNMNLGLIMYNLTSAKFEKQNKSYEAIAKPTRVDYSNYTKATEQLKKEYLEAEPYLLKAYQTKKNATLNKALYNLYARTQQKEKIESLGLTKE